MRTRVYGVGRVEGPLREYRDGFRDELTSLGFKGQSIICQLCVMGHVSRWLGAQGLTAADLSPSRVAEFAGARRAAGYRDFIALDGLRQLRRFLVRVGALAAVSTEPVLLPAVAVVLDGYARFLREQRNVAEVTVRRHRQMAGRFLERFVVDERVEFERINGAVVLEFISTECSATKLKWSVTGPVRGLCRFLFLTGAANVDWSVVIPRVASWRLASLPKALTATQVEAMFAACEPTRRSGRRDAAMLALMLRLGLRAGEVARLGLDDIDWRAGRIEVHSSKSRRIDELPLPADVGDTLAAYLREGRPPLAGHRVVFCRSVAPHGPLSAAGVKSAVGKVSHRAGIGPIGAHRFRHTAATRMLAGGADLAEIAQVLRHGDTNSTARYAKVDRTVLVELALPWPLEA